MKTQRQNVKSVDNACLLKETIFMEPPIKKHSKKSKDGHTWNRSP